MRKGAGVERILWSIALPGFGQFLNGKAVKGVILLVLEFLINQQSGLNSAIMASFLGDIQTAIRLTDFQWLMFYPCVYMFAIYDAYRDALAGEVRAYSAFPFAFCAFFATVGIMYSAHFRIFGMLLGPVWLPMIFCFIGIGVGHGIKYLILKANRNPV